METRLHFDILRQPDDTTCGPTCLHAVYRFFGDDLPLDDVLAEVGRLEAGGTLAVFLGSHALRRGYDATISTFNLHVFDPTWFFEDGHSLPTPRLIDKLRQQCESKGDPKLVEATEAYVEFLELGGRLRMRDLTAATIRHYLKKSVPILTGLNATYLYGEPRERLDESSGTPLWVADDVRGEPSGHFVILCGYDVERRTVLVADPLVPNPLATEHLYDIDLDRVTCAILLGIVTYDANFLVVRPQRRGGLVDRASDLTTGRDDRPAGA